MYNLKFWATYHIRYEKHEEERKEDRGDMSFSFGAKKTLYGDTRLYVFPNLSQMVEPW